MEGLLEYLRQGFIEQGEAAALNIAPFSFQLVLALVVLGVTRFAAIKVERSVARGTALVNNDRHTAFLTSRAASVAVWGVGALVLMGVLGIGWTAVAATLGLVGLAITVSMQDVLKNYVAGIYLLLERPFRIGDLVQIKEHKGTVEDVRLRTTALRTTEGSQVIIPNATIFVEVVVNLPKEKVEQR